MTRSWSITRRRALWLSLGIIVSVSTQTKGKATEIYFKSRKQNALPDFSQKTVNFFLKDFAAAKGLIYGSESLSFYLSRDKNYATRFAQEIEILVAGWELKWCAGKKPLRPSPDSFDFTAGDWIVNFAHDHGLLFRGHTLVWHKALPLWFKSKVNPQNAEQFLGKHIQTVVGRYAGYIHSWDVVNEAINPSDGRSDGLRKTQWLEFLGSDYIDFAFRVAAEADPQALLVYNETGLDYDTPEDEAKRKALLKLLYRLKAMGTPIHALGIQAHLRAKENRFSPDKLRDFLRHVGSLDLKIMITELDVSDQGLPQDIDERDRLVAQHYYDYLSVVLDEPAVIGVLTWGLSDRYTWLSNHRPRADGLPVRPLPLDRDLNRKPAWYAIAQAFDNAPNRAFK